jgi:hypothetical protein
MDNDLIENPVIIITRFQFSVNNDGLCFINASWYEMYNLLIKKRFKFTAS